MAAVHPATSNAAARAGAAAPMAEINVTPFVDVMLVLLIVFMVTAPLLTVGVPVDLPKTRAPALGQDREPLSVTVQARRQDLSAEQPVAEDELVAKLTAIAANGYDQRIFVRGDKSVDYGTRDGSDGPAGSAAGFTHIGLVTDVAKPKPDETLDGRAAAARAPDARRVDRARLPAVMALIVAATLFTWSHKLDIAGRIAAVVPVDLVTIADEDQCRAEAQPPPKTAQDRDSAAARWSPRPRRSSHDVEPRRSPPPPEVERRNPSRKTAADRPSRAEAEAARRKESQVDDFNALLNKLTAPAAASRPTPRSRPRPIRASARRTR